MYVTEKGAQRKNWSTKRVTIKATFMMKNYSKHDDQQISDIIKNSTNREIQHWTSLFYIYVMKWLVNWQNNRSTSNILFIFQRCLICRPFTRQWINELPKSIYFRNKSYTKEEKHNHIFLLWNKVIASLKNSRVDFEYRGQIVATADRYKWIDRA